MQVDNAKTVKAASRANSHVVDLAGIERDQALAAKIIRGDVRAEEAFVKENIVWMRPLASKFLADQATADDVVQEAFANAFRALKSYQGRSTLKTWLHRITVNSALMKIRKIKRLGECDIDAHQPPVR